MKCLIVTLAVLLTGCDFGLKEDLNITKAELFITRYENTGKVDTLMLNHANADAFEVNRDHYLFVVNSFNGDFNGWVYSKNAASIPRSLKFQQFIIKQHDPTKGNWTKVYGKW
ncbi:MAG: hypothetical protein JKY52_12235 [Flavobacteriales bacterium]|nr:hypothetical protein [Flavobacteriales bacterium]